MSKILAEPSRDAGGQRRDHDLVERMCRNRRLHRDHGVAHDAAFGRNPRVPEPLEDDAQPVLGDVTEVILE